jgi:hypothetical protein
MISGDCGVPRGSLAAHIRNTLPALRDFTPEAATGHLIADIEQVRHALVGDA